MYRKINKRDPIKEKEKLLTMINIKNNDIFYTKKPFETRKIPIKLESKEKRLMHTLIKHNPGPSYYLIKNKSIENDVFKLNERIRIAEESKKWT